MTGAQLCKQLDDLKAIRRPLEEHKRQCYAYSLPLRGLLYGQDADISPEEIQTQAALLQAGLFDSTASDAVMILAGAMVSNMTPANGLWYGLETGDEEPGEVKDYLDKLVRDTHHGIHASNYDAPAFEALVDVVIGGECALYIEEGDTTDFIFDAWPMTHCWISCSKRGGKVDIIFYQFSLTASQAVKEYGSKCPPKIAEAATKNPFQRFPFFQAILPRELQPGKAKTLREELQPFASYHVCMTSKRICRSKGYAEFPVAVPRWMKLPNSAYAQGQMSVALPDAKTLNTSERIVLNNADWQASGMWGAVDDGVMNPKTVKIGPRKIVFMRDKESFFPINPPGRVDVGAGVSEGKRNAIRRVLMADKLQPLEDGVQKTAAEWHYRMGLLRQMLGPLFGRLQTEFLQSIVFRCTGIKVRAEIRKGNLPPEQIKEKVLRLRYVSPLARAQQLEEVAAMDRYEESKLAKAEAAPGVIDNYDWEEADRIRGKALGVPEKLILDVKKTAQRTKLREDRMAQAAQPGTGAAAGQMPPTPQPMPAAGPLQPQGAMPGA